MYYNNLFRALLVELGQRINRREETKKIIEFVGSGSQKVLEVGCNLGYLSGLIADKGAVVTAIDANSDSRVLNIARRRINGRNITFLQVSGLNMPFENNSFDCVVLSHVLEHFFDPVFLLNEIRRVMKNDHTGKLIIVVPKEDYLGQNTSDHKLLFQSENDLLCLMESNNFLLCRSMDIGKAIIASYTVL